MYQLINKFIQDSKEIDDNVFPFMANKNWRIGNNIYYSGPYWNDLEAQELIYAVMKGKWLSSGEKVNKFEKEFSDRFEFDYSVMVNSGSSANLVMIAALKKYYGWEDGDEVIVCSCGFATTIAPLAQAGLKPVFVDINWDDLNWNMDQVEEKITERTRAVFSSPVLGNAYDMDRLVEFCKSKDIHIIADNCDSLGSKYKEEYLTKHAVAASCSFYPAHHICTIEGGMVSSNNKAIIDLARSFAWWGRGCYCVGQQNLLSNGVCGRRFDTWLDGYEDIVDHKYVFSQMGYNLKPLDMQGAVGSVQLLKFNDIHRLRRKNKDRIQSIIETIDGCRVVNERDDSETSWFGVPIICDNKKLKHSLVAHLEKNKVQTRNYFAGNILLHPGYSHLDDAMKYPESNKVLNTVFFLGCSPVITDDMIDYIETVVEDFKNA